MKTQYKFLILTVFVLSFFMISCSEDLMETNKGETALVLSANSNNITLDILEPEVNAVVLSWTSGTNAGTNAAITYKLQIAKAGDNFENPLDMAMDQGVYSVEFTNNAFNQILLDSFNVAQGDSVDLEARVIATVHSDNVNSQTSPVITLHVTTYKPISNTLYLIGSAAPNGWSADNATKMNSISGTVGGFTWQGRLNAGELKFITTLGNFVPSYGKGNADDSLYYRESFDDSNDTKFNIPSSGIYKITLNLITLSISVETLDAPEYSQLWFVGGFTGWNFVEMREDMLDPYVFHYNAKLNSSSGTSDEFKIATQQSFDDNVVYFRPSVDKQGSGSSLDVAKWSISENSNDYKWKLNDGTYKITFNLSTMKIDIVPFTPYSSMYMIGSATSAGWDINSAIAMTAVSGDPYKFTWTGTLNTGELKFSCDKQSDWGGDWFLATSSGLEPSGSEEQMLFSAGGSNPDNKWQINTAGTYTIVLDQLQQLVTIAKQ